MSVPLPGEEARYYYQGSAGIVTVGGVRSTTLRDLAGILLGSAHTAARDIGIPHAQGDKLSAWSTEQGRLVEKLKLSPAAKSSAAASVYMLGGDLGVLPIGESQAGWMSMADIETKWKDAYEVIVLQDATLSLARDHLEGIVLLDNVIVLDVSRMTILAAGHNFISEWPIQEIPEWWPRDWRFHYRTMTGSVAEALARAWGCSVRDLLTASRASTDEKRVSREVWVHQGKVQRESVMILRRPKVRAVRRGLQTSVLPETRT